MNLILFDSVRESYELTSQDPRHRHICTVLRAHPGDTLRIGVVSGPEGEGIVTAVGKGGTSISVTGWSDGRVGRPVEVIIGHPRPPVLQRLWRDLAAVRVGRVRIFGGDLGERSYFDSSVWTHLEERLREGMSQGRHTALPIVTRHQSLDSIFDELDGVRYRYYGGVDRSQAFSFREMLAEISTAGADSVISVCIGPERGFSAREHELLEEHRFRAVFLGNAVLRTETAANALAVGIASVLE